MRTLLTIFLLTGPLMAQWPFGGSGDASRLRGKNIVSPLSCTDGQVLTWVNASSRFECAGSAGGAPTTATYITQTPDGSLSAEQALSALATGILKNTNTTGVLSIGVSGTDYVGPTTATTYTAGAKQTLAASASTAGFALVASALPSTPANNDVHLDSADGLLSIRVGGAWTKYMTETGIQTATNKTFTAPVINVGSDATGDIYYRNSGGLFTRLSIGSTNECLIVTAGIPDWGSCSGGSGATDLSGLTDLRTTATTTVITMAAGNAGINGVTTAIAGTGTITKNSGTDTGTFYTFVDSAGARTCLAGTGVTIGNYTVSSGFAGSTCASGTAFPAGSSYRARTTITSGTFDTTVLDDRVLESRDLYTAGTGLSLASNAFSVNSAVVGLLDVASSWTKKQSFNGEGATAAAIRLVSQTAPSSPVDGDCWYASNALTCRINGASVNLGAGGGGTTQIEKYLGYCTPDDTSPAALPQNQWRADVGSPGAASCSGSLHIDFMPAYSILGDGATSGWATLLDLSSWNGTGNITVRIRFMGNENGTAGNVTWETSVRCYANGDSQDAAAGYDTDVVTTTVSEGSPAFDTQTATATLTTAGALSECTNAGWARVRVARTGAAGSDTSVQGLYFFGATFTWPTS